MAEKVLYCQAELSTGIVKNNGVWETSRFKLQRYTIKFNDDYTRLEGVSFKPMTCSKPYDYKSPEHIACVHLWGSHETFTYNTITKRYLLSNMSSGGYVNNGPDTESLSAGTCESF